MLDTLYKQSVLLDGPAGYWRLNETSGTTANATAGINYTYTGQVTVGNRAKPSILGGYAPTFDATGTSEGKIVLTDYPDMTTHSFDMLVWISSTQTDGKPVIFGKLMYFASTTSSFPVCLYWDAANSVLKLQLDLGNDFSANLTIASQTVTTNAWHYVACVVRNNGLCELRVDNTNTTASLSGAISSPGSTVPWIIGSANENSTGANDSGFCGSIAEVALYPYALNQSQFDVRAGIITNAKSVSGTIRDDTNTTVQRTVHLLRRSSGLLVDSTTSASDGTYTLNTPYTDEHIRIVYDNDSGVLYNDIIDRLYPV